MSAYQVSGAPGITCVLHEPRADSAASPGGLALDPLDLAWLKIRKRQQERRHERLEVRQSICPGPQDNDSEGQFIDALLKREIAIDGHKSIESTDRAIEQRSVANARPAKIEYREYVVAVDVAR